MTPDWTKAPKSAQYFNVNDGSWYRRKIYEVQVWRYGSWKYTHTTPLILPNFIERPDDAESSGRDK